MASTRRVLLLSYHFPPSSAAGAVRWGAFTKVGVARDFTFDVLAGGLEGATEPRHDSIDGSPVRVHRLADYAHPAERLISGIAKVRRSLGRKASGPSESQESGPATSIQEQIAHRDNVLRLRAIDAGWRRNLSAWRFTQESYGWVRQAIRRGIQLGAERRFDVVVSSAPPYMSQFAAYKIAKSLGVPLVLDFRDPWTVHDILPTEIATPLFYALADRYERPAVRRSSLIVMNTELARTRMQEYYPQSRVIVIRNGFDGSVPMPQHDPQRFVMTYAGSIYLDRDPRPIFAALKSVVQTTSATPRSLMFQLIGGCSEYAGVPTMELAERAGVRDFVQVKPSVDRVELYREFARSAVLINLPQSARLAIPSKIFEYLHFPSWLLALEEGESATSELLAQTNAIVRSPAEVEKISEAIVSMYTRYMGGEMPSALARGGEYGANAQATALFDRLGEELQDPTGAQRGRERRQR